VSVLHVIKRQPLAPLTVRFTVPWIKSEQKVKDAARKLVDRTVQQLIKAGFTAEPVCKLGDPAEEIMNVASKRQADLIVMGAKGLGTLDRILLGSVSTRVVQYATCPVLVVR
jgi:nucleotide-binding universal stress UspA family protein